MKIAIIIFSPSGNTKKVAKTFKSIMEFESDLEVQLVDITGSSAYFSENQTSFIKSLIVPHDVLMIGGPVYAHHLQYHVQDLIKSLPTPDGKIWGNIAIPFVTYGGISSGLALEEAGELLEKSGRTIFTGLKVAASHRMTRSFMDQEFNKGRPGDEILPFVQELKQKLLDPEFFKLKTRRKCSFQYQPRLKAMFINTVFNEKKWHKERYPQIHLTSSFCIRCGDCVLSCPVLHLKKNPDDIVFEDSKNECIHCFNCVIACPQKCIRPSGDLEKVRAFMHSMIQKHGNKELPENRLF